MGYIISNEEILKIIYFFKESFDLCTSLFTQLIILDYLKNNNIKNIINNRISVYKKLLDKTIEYINKNYSESISSYSKVKGGLFIHIIFKNDIDSNIFEIGNNYYIDKDHRNETRINICSTLIDNN